MILAFALALQEPPMTPLPPQMEPALEAYARCLSDRSMDKLIQTPKRGPKIFEQVQAACKEVRVNSIAASDAALAILPAFADAPQRHAFIDERFNGLDQLLEETFSGGMDPDKWEK